LHSVETRGAVVPRARLSWVAESLGESGSPEKNRIESRPHPHRRPLVSGIARALIKNTRRGDISNQNE
jgi:hypothetical protein